MLEILPQLGLVALQTFIIYLFLVVALSMLGHRQSAELNITELVVIMVIGSAVETAMVAGDTSLWAGLTSGTTLMVSNWGLARLMDRWPRLRRLIAGRPILLVYNAQLLPRHLAEAGLDEEDVLEGLRERGYDTLDQVRIAVLEMDGAISVVPRDKAKGDAPPAGQAPA
ncbi:MAG: YetF domain-containing protein [Anaerolineae bacterium]